MGRGVSDIVPIVAGLLDFLLNVVGLLLWFNWRASGLKLAAPGVVSLAAAIQRTEILEPRRWFSFACLIALLIIRALVYCQIGSRVNWIPSIDLTAIVLPFRSDLLSRMFLFSLLSFALALGIVYASLLLLSVVNEKSRTTDYFSRLIALQLGWIGKWFWPIRFFLAPLAAALLWFALSKLFVKLGIIPPPKNAAHAWQIAGVMAISIVIAWKYVLVLFLGLHFLNTYVYLGNSSFWQFVTLTGNRLTLPIRWIPLCLGKLDLAPAILIVAVIIGSHYASISLARLYPRLPL
jgi:hypothetical protein